MSLRTLSSHKIFQTESRCLYGVSVARLWYWGEGAAGVASVRRDQRLSLHCTETVPAGFEMMARAGPVRDAGGISVTRI